MAKKLGIVTALVLLISLFLGFKNKAAFEAEQGTLQTENSKLAENRSKLKETEDTLELLPKDISAVEAQIADLGEQEASQKQLNEELTTQTKTKETKLTEDKAKLDAIREKTNQLGDIKNLAEQLKLTNQESQALSEQVSAAEAKLANLTASNNQVKESSAKLKAELDAMSGGQSLPSLNTRIRSYYPSWGFVTLAGGNNVGVVANSTLNVIRDDQAIAKLLVTTVESNTSSASIVPDSLSEGVTLQVGDRVVAGDKPAAPATTTTVP